ncbi:GNAT family N-acetyltransferase [Streptomyces sp. Tu 3180]|nr:GNAT family N-acetyltransferase [Streptomyces sp. Tu 3180]
MIRTALAVEAPDVAALHRRARSTYCPDGLPDDGTDWRARWREAVERPGGHVLCAVRDARLVGVASFRTPGGDPADTVTLFQFHVDPGHWRSGVGTALHTACVERWRADGRREASLEVRVGNHRAQAFYARRGRPPPAPAVHRARGMKPTA